MQHFPKGNLPKTPELVPNVLEARNIGQASHLPPTDRWFHAALAELCNTADGLGYTTVGTYYRLVCMCTAHASSNSGSNVAATTHSWSILPPPFGGKQISDKTTCMNSWQAAIPNNNRLTIAHLAKSLRAAACLP